MSRNFGIPPRPSASKPYVTDLEPTESPAPHKRVLVNDIDPTEYSREEYDRKLKERGINPEPWLKYPD